MLRFQNTQMVMSYDVVRALREVREELTLKADAPIDEMFVDVGALFSVLCVKFGLSMQETIDVMGVEVWQRLKGREARR